MLVQELDGVAGDREGHDGRDPAASRAKLEWLDIAFAWKVCKHVRSNAIVFAKDRATIGIGAGQMSRVDSVRLAVEKAQAAFGEEAGAARRLRRRLRRLLPVRRRAAGGDRGRRSAVIQPGGIEARRRGDRRLRRSAGVAMVFTGRRHFRH